MLIAIVVFQGLFELIGLGSFLFGYFADLNLLMIIGGILVVLDDVIEILMGVLNPLFPIILAIALVIIFSPWYVGIFWATASFKVLGIPTSLIKIFQPQRIIKKATSSKSFF